MTQYIFTSIQTWVEHLQQACAVALFPIRNYLRASWGKALNFLLPANLCTTRFAHQHHLLNRQSKSFVPATPPK